MTATTPQAALLSAPNPLLKRCYTMSEPHLSGYRVVIGFERMEDAQDAHEYIAKLQATQAEPSPRVTPDMLDHLKEQINVLAEITATQVEPPKHVSMPQYWAVDVFSDGAKIVSIGSDWLSGERQLDELDERTIIGAAQHLLAFVGYGLPPTSFDPDAQAEPVHAGSASLLDGCKSIMDSIAVSSSVIEHNRQEPVQAEPTLRDYADSLVEAGHDFWKACKREAGGGAVRWLSCDDGTLIVFTRGEYRDTIMENIGCYKAPEVFFEEDGITAAESKEPAQAGELPDERELFEAEMRCGEEWGHRSLKTRADGRYENWQVNLLWGVWQARAALSARKPAVPMTPESIHMIGEQLADCCYGPAGGPMECYQFEPGALVEFVRAIEGCGIGLEVKP